MIGNHLLLEFYVCLGLENKTNPMEESVYELMLIGLLPNEKVQISRYNKSSGGYTCAGKVGARYSSGRRI